ncbi:CRP/FNR family transcriptional regulator, transcriptional activator FtrB [Cognatiyoonia koreensis]|uniref:CRP/FNR family transcriptional regulator, transcriptional activator FtrB n=1 Tax=Cognatiyoonia koreensis TaxID=364200 RepID=A0A1I0QUI9_9RHOB|nr:cyclic nucleotide-binding domain-containing protein [Cognatiyoonia koreensis]SEW31290.1 CRP/FNR family transcriptional regulator, transcriptional activator FtrB [Cognatiyoonia koreensis]
MPESYRQDVRELALFADMELAHFEALMRAAYVQSFPPRVDLITEGDEPDFLHVVMSGSVDLFSSWNGRETSLATVRPVSTFILAATIKNAPYLMSARTLEKSRIVLLPSEDVRAIFDKDGAFARAIVSELSQCYRAVVKNTKNLKLRTSLERLANYLLRQRDHNKADIFDLTMEKRRLASFLGMTPENLSRAFKSLEPYGVRVQGNRIHVTDADDLIRFARPSSLIDDPAT